MAIIPILLTFILDVITDLKRWGRINHIRGAVLRVPGFALAAWLDPWTLLLALTYWGAFDVTLALARRLPALYVGETSRLDRLQRRYPWLVWVKIVLGAGAVLGFILAHST